MDYSQSNCFFDKASKIIPMASQTYSKSYYSVPKGHAPLFLEKGKGSHVWDIDGNEYVDLVNGLLSVSIGYANEEINRAIEAQLKKGINFSLPHKLECEVAEKLINLIPCAEMVRFGKNGTDVTSAAVRLAREYTGKNTIAICGYHGWQDWYIGTTSKDAGVPDDVKKFSKVFRYNDLRSLDILFSESNDIAAVIMEPMSVEYPDPEFLSGVRKLTQDKGSLLIFDEMITGFRLSNGGAQELFSVTPDLATFGKGMANGMPLSAIVGKKEIMSHMENIFFSGTFGGETLSLASANKVIDIYMELPVVSHLSRVGKALNTSLTKLKDEYGVDWYDLIGHESWMCFQITHHEETVLKSLLIKYLAEAGVLSIGSHNISYATKEEEIVLIESAYRYAFEKIESDMNFYDSLSEAISNPIMPVFKVR